MHTTADSLGNTEGGDFEGRYNARFVKLTSIQINPFVKYKGLEFFGIYEVANGDNETESDKEGAFTQMSAELIYRFGQEEKFYIGGRYNTVSGMKMESATEDLQIDRLNIGGGWFLSKNILAKVEYVKQQYTGDAWTGRFAGAEFEGVNFEAAISF